MVGLRTAIGTPAESVKVIVTVPTVLQTKSFGFEAAHLAANAFAPVEAVTSCKPFVANGNAGVKKVPKVAPFVKPAICEVLFNALNKIVLVGVMLTRTPEGVVF